MAVPPQGPLQSTAQQAAKMQPLRPWRTVPCPWCRQPLPPACCGGCVSRAARSARHTDSGVLAGEVQATQRVLAASLAQASRRLALRERRTLLAERVLELRAAAERRGLTVLARRRHLEERREDLRVRRRRHEVRAAEWAPAKRRLEGKRSRVSRDEFLRDPMQHVTTLGAFHVLQELSVVSTALQAERRKRCAELVALFPLKWIVSDASGDHTVTLGQVQSFGVAGVLQEQEIQDLEAAISMLVPLLSALAAYLDVTLPFPCTGARGSARAAALGHRSTGSANSPAWWTWPCVLHPFRGRWQYFRFYDNLCTSEFALALRLIDEDLRWLCIQQGEVPAHFGALQLLAQILSSEHLGCLSSPIACHPALSTGSASQVDTPGTGSLSVAASGGTRESGESARLASSLHGHPRSESDSTVFSKASPQPKYRSPRRLSTQSTGGISVLEDEDGEWMVVEHERSECSSRLS